MSILDHPIWPELQPYIRIQVYGRDGGPDRPRHRIEVEQPTAGALRARLLGAEMACVSCGRTIRPIRQRHGDHGTWYYAATCELEQSYACARSAPARLEYTAIREAMRGVAPPSRQPGLF